MHDTMYLCFLQHTFREPVFNDLIAAGALIPVSWTGSTDQGLTAPGIFLFVIVLYRHKLTMRYLYTIALYLYFAGVRVASVFSVKARLWVSGRRNWHQHMLESARSHTDSDQLIQTIWVHCASLGEFEQGRPVIEAFKAAHPGWRILLTFFSPSGYENKKKYPHVDYVFYLPVDTPANQKKFLDIWQPDMAVFIKYEYWYNFFGGLAKRGIKTYVVSAIFRPGQHFFRFYGKWFRKHLRNITHFFVQDEASRLLLEKYGIKHVTVSGDTRFDRVYLLGMSAQSFPLIKQFAADHTTIVAGSTWPKDEKLLADLLRSSNDRLRLIIAPHEVHEENIARLEKELGGFVCRYSKQSGRLPDHVRVMIIDSIGILSQLYQYGDMAYVGGGFGKGIHNILEAATFGIPVIFGPNHRKFAEAADLQKRGGAFCVRDEGELRRVTDRLLGDADKLTAAGDACRKYVEEKRGAAGLVIKHLTQDL